MVRPGSHIKEEQKEASANSRQEAGETRDGRDHNDSPKAAKAQWTCNTDKLLHQIQCPVSENSDQILNMCVHLGTNTVGTINPMRMRASCKYVCNISSFPIFKISFL